MGIVFCGKMLLNTLALAICITTTIEAVPLQSNESLHDGEEVIIDSKQNGQKPPMYNEDLFEGDILGMRSYNDRSSIADPHHLWAGGIVYYSIEESAIPVLQKLVLEAIEEFENQTCLKFVERRPEVKDYIMIYNDNGCNSQIGRTGGMQAVNLGDGCHVKTIVMHEFLHALGFYHEQSRSDRDKYVEINWDNIWNTTLHNFEMAYKYDNNLLDEDFDYTSLMMYEWNAWAKNFSEPTIIPKQSGIELKPAWEKSGFSDGDVRKINKLYQCFGQKRPDPPKVPDFVCDFETDDCGIINDDVMTTYFDRRLTKIGGRSGNFLVVDPELVTSSYARLITPYFKVHGRHTTCFSLDYFLEGEGMQELEITQQDDKTIALAYIEPQKPQWMHYQASLNTTGVREVRFFILMTLKRGAPGIGALDNFVFSRNPC